MLKTQKRFRVGKIFEVVGLDATTKSSDFDDLLTVDLLHKIEMRQRIELDSKRRASRSTT